jgi:hypothetical protein
MEDRASLQICFQTLSNVRLHAHFFSLEHQTTSISLLPFEHRAWPDELSSPEILQQARRKYGAALLLTNTALRSPKTATHDTTLLTVLLLDFFEKLASKHEFSIDSKHMEGAIALVRLHGQEQFHNCD